MTFTLRQVRRLAEKTQVQLAKEIGVSEATIIRWEKGLTEPKAKHLRQISQVCGVAEQDIFLPSQSN